jgi:predicted MPP superfamily phosphohydrolase
MMDVYARIGLNLVLTGHAHGGQFRLPLIGGLYAPHQGVFPKYTSGLYKKNSTGMVVSRGLGNSGFPLRLFNRPELVIITLRRS